MKLAGLNPANCSPRRKRNSPPSSQSSILGAESVRPIIHYSCAIAWPMNTTSRGGSSLPAASEARGRAQVRSRFFTGFRGAYS